MRTLLSSLMLASILLLPACTTDVPHGRLKEDTVIASIKPGVTNKDDVLKLLGAPSSEASFGPPVWYYISSIKRTHSLLAPEITDQHVTEILFDPSGLVRDVKQYTLADGKKVEMVARVTPSEGQTLGFFEQIFSNLGRFNKDNANATSNTHGGGTVPGLPPVGR